MSELLGRNAGAVAALAAAFERDAGMGAILPAGEDERRMARVRALCQHLLALSERHGCVHTARAGVEVDGVVAMLAPGRTEPGLFSLMEAGAWRLPAAVGVRACLRALTISDAIAARHRSIMGAKHHWYLFQMGVRPAAQRRGLGSRLLSDALRRVDQDGMSCYLETFSERNVAYYQRFGFALQALHTVTVDGLALPFWCMQRAARLA